MHPQPSLIVGNNDAGYSDVAVAAVVESGSDSDSGSNSGEAGGSSSSESGGGGSSSSDSGGSSSR